MNIELKPFNDIPYELQMETRNWRNSKEVKKYFKISNITVEMHKKWLESLKETNPKNIAFVINKDNRPIGVTYFHSVNYSQKQADWGIYIYNEELRGQGIGEVVLTKCIEYAKEILNLNKLFLDVLKSNHRAIKLYEKLGFTRIYDGGGTIMFHLIPDS